jgi:hypothetical protein
MYIGVEFKKRCREIEPRRKAVTELPTDIKNPKKKADIMPNSFDLDPVRILRGTKSKRGGMIMMQDDSARERMRKIGRDSVSWTATDCC